MILRHESNQRLSKVVVANGFAFLSGITARNRLLDVSSQTSDILEQIDALLLLAGSGKTQIVSATIWLKDMRHFQSMNSAWEQWVVPGHAPARATVQAAMNDPGILVEIMVQALAGRS